MDRIAKVALMAAYQIIGIDLSSEPDRTAYWSPPRQAKTPDPKKRAKVKAARKQKHRNG